MQVLNASEATLVSGAKSVESPTEPAPPPYLAPRPWPWTPVEP